MAEHDFDFDLFTIGAGSGGVAASRRAAGTGARVGICEDSRVGGTCVIRGCVPKKLLMYAGQFRDGFEDASGFGWAGGVPAFDWPTLLANKNREIDRLNRVYIDMLAAAGVELVTGRGRLVDRHTVEVAGRRITAERILIATGGRPVKLPIPGIEHAITSNEALELAALPRRLAVLGGGYIACEFASIFAALGVEVTQLIRAAHLLNGFDDDIRQALAPEMARRGVRLETGVRPAAIERGGDAPFAVVADDGRRFPADLVLAATGRRPNSDGLGLAEAGVRTNDRGAVVVDDGYQTGLEGVYAVGDVTDRINLTPVAIAEGRALVETLFNANPTRVNYDTVPSAVFTAPPLGTVGLSEAAARARGHDLDIYVSRFRPMKGTLSGREERTLMKLVVDRASGRVLGCHMLGADAPEIVQGLAIALTCGATKQDFDRTIGLHPSAAEEFVTMRTKRGD